MWSLFSLEALQEKNAIASIKGELLKLIFVLYLNIIKPIGDLFEGLKFMTIKENFHEFLKEIQVPGFSLSHRTFNTPILFPFLWSMAPAYRI